MLNNNLDSIDNYQHLIHNQSVRQLLNNPLLLKDCWSLSQDLCLSAPAHRKFSSLDFTNYSQDWLKIVVKIYILLRVGSGTSASTIQKDVYNLQKFDSFLKSQYVYSFEQINSGIFENFDYYLRSKNIKEITIHRYYATLVVFFDTCRLEGWFDVSTYWFKGRRKSFYPNHEEINYIPEEVWNQLESNLHHLPEQIQRMVLVIRTTGIRIGELLNMPYDCLRKRDNQWRLRFLTEKYEIEDELPITADLAVVIKEQQEYIVELFGNSYECLFCNSNASGWKTLKKNSDGTVLDKMTFVPQPKIMSNLGFNLWLNRLAKKYDICDKHGDIWHFKSHQFRKTITTIMSNAGVRDLIIQKYLRHRSPNMQRYYKHILKQVLGEEYEELMQDKKYVDITGKVSLHQPKNPVTEFLRRKLYQITTQYGECHRPTLKSPCQTVNACWRCEHWRTSTEDLDYLEADLERIEKELEIAKSKGMLRQQQGLEDDRHNLVKRIQGLEELKC